MDFKIKNLITLYPPAKSNSAPVDHLYYGYHTDSNTQTKKAPNLAWKAMKVLISFGLLFEIKIKLTEKSYPGKSWISGKLHDHSFLKVEMNDSNVIIVGTVLVVSLVPFLKDHLVITGEKLSDCCCPTAGDVQNIAGEWVLIFFKHFLAPNLGLRLIWCKPIKWNGKIFFEVVVD